MLESNDDGFNLEEARKTAYELYGLEVTAGQLSGYFDQNFLLDQPSGHRYVLKISQAEETHLDLQVQALRHVAAAAFDLTIPSPVRTLKQAWLGKVHTSGGRARFTLLLTWVEGNLWADRDTDKAQLQQSLGRYTAKLDSILESFSHPAMDRLETWDLKHLGALRDCLDVIETSTRRRLIEQILDRFESSISPRLAGQPRSVIHNDINPHNVLLDTDGQLTGLIDFGDVMRTHTVCEIGIAMAYAMLDCRDPVAAGRHVLNGYLQVRNLNTEEIDLAPDLALARLAMIVTYGTFNLVRNPSNTYLGVSLAPAWRVLEALSGHGHES